MADFVHLHVHTQYSLLDGLSNINQLAMKAKELGHASLAITDHGGMYGAVHFFNACKREGIKPIIGVEAYMSATSRFDKQAKMGADQYHLTLLAKDMEGYRNLMRMVSAANLEGFSYKPRIDMELLEQYHEGVLATSGCASSLISKKLLQDKPEEARAWTKRFLELFGDDFYIEIQAHKQVDVVEKLRPLQVALARELGIPLVATNDVHYIEKSDADAQDALLAVQTRKLISDPNRMSMLDSPSFYLRSTDEMEELFAEYPESLSNTVAIAEKCNVEIPTGSMIFPEYPLPEGKTEEQALREMAHEKLLTKIPKPTEDNLKRLDYELDVICSKGYASYFLIVQDFVNWAKRNGIRVGPGRGSAAGSLVGYSLNITSISPITHDLPFERFMNPQRPSPPDIDIDIADERRDEVIRYTAEKYGTDHVAQVITFGTMEARAAIRDIGRVLGMSFAETDKVAKLIPQGMKMQQAIDNVGELADLLKEPAYKRLVDLVLKVEGSARHSSTHAAAVIIADKPLTNYTPIQREAKGDKIVTQYDMYALDLNVQDDAIGLLKMDFLGLRNLSILGRAIEFVEQETGEQIDESQFPLDEPKVYELLSQGLTTGVFQLESGGMRRVAKKLMPERFSDITAMVALYRPGPMELIDDFIAGKKDPSKIKYPHEVLKPVLEETYGIPVYQEQVLQIANVFAGYSLGEADILRRAIGKKKKYILDKEKKNFIKGAGKKGYDKDTAVMIWAFIEKFAGYGFNKAHSASYAMIAYQTAYMKAIYPVEYMAALLSVESNSHGANKEEKVAQAIEECWRMDIPVLPPDINGSVRGFSIVHGDDGSRSIRFGFGAIKHVGEAAIDAIIEARTEGGDFASMTDFCMRADTRRVNKTVVESLVKAGAFDRYGKRAAILAIYDVLRKKAQDKQKQKQSGQDSLFDMMTSEKTVVTKDPLPDVPEFPKRQLLDDEKYYLGVYIQENPFVEALSQLPKGLFKIGHLDPFIHKHPKRVGGILSRVRQVYTRSSNKEMAFGTLKDASGEVDVVFFPKVYEAHKQDIYEDAIIAVRGKVDEREDRVNLLVDEVETVTLTDSEIVMSTHEIVIPKGTDKSVLQQVGDILKAHPGDTKIRILVPQGEAHTTITLPYTVAYTEDVASQIEALLTS